MPTNAASNVTPSDKTAFATIIRVTAVIGVAVLVRSLIADCNTNRSTERTYAYEDRPRSIPQPRREVELDMPTVQDSHPRVAAYPELPSPPSPSEPKTRTPPRRPPATKENRSRSSAETRSKGSFSVGASKQRVMSIQGQPDQILSNSVTRETWIYGAASVVFEEGKVVEYRNVEGTLRIE